MKPILITILIPAILCSIYGDTVRESNLQHLKAKAAERGRPTSRISIPAGFREDTTAFDPTIVSEKKVRCKSPTKPLVRHPPRLEFNWSDRNPILVDENIAPARPRANTFNELFNRNVEEPIIIRGETLSKIPRSTTVPRRELPQTQSRIHNRVRPRMEDVEAKEDNVVTESVNTNPVVDYMKKLSVKERIGAALSAAALAGGISAYFMIKDAPAVPAKPVASIVTTAPVAATEAFPVTVTKTVAAAATGTIPLAATKIVQVTATETIPVAAIEAVIAPATETVPAAATETVPAAATETVPVAATEAVPAEQN